MTKLTFTARNAIADAITGHAFAKRLQDLRDEEHGLALRVYTFAFDVTDRNAWAKLPAGWMPEAESVFVSLGEASKCYQLNFRDKHTVRMPYTKYNTYHGTSALLVETKTPLYKDILEWRKESQAVQDDKTKRNREVRQALLSFKTVPQVLKEWPEIKTFVDDAVSVPAAVKLPMPLIKDLNKALKLPPKKAA